MPSSGPSVSPLARRASDAWASFERFGVAHHHGVERGGGLRAVVGIDPCEIGLDQFNGSGLAGFERGAQLGNGNFGDFDHAVTAELLMGDALSEASGYARHVSTALADVSCGLEHAGAGSPD